MRVWARLLKLFNEGVFVLLDVLRQGATIFVKDYLDVVQSELPVNRPSIPIRAVSVHQGDC